MGRIEEELPTAPPSPYNNDQQITPPPPVHQPSAYSPPSVNQPAVYPSPPIDQPAAYPPKQVNDQPPQGNYYPQTPPPAYPPPSPPPVQFPPTPTKGDFEGNDPVQYPPAQENTQQQQQPQMNTNFVQFNQQIPIANGIPINNIVQVSYNEDWSSGLFDCMNNPTNAIFTLFFPWLTFGQIAEIIDNGQTACATSALIYGLVGAVIWFPSIVSCSYRTKLRNKYGLIESPAPDWITHFLCEPCALCQAYRELEQRGLDPSIGWIGNVSRQQQQVVMMVPTTQNMNGY